MSNDKDLPNAKEQNEDKDFLQDVDSRFVSEAYKSSQVNMPSSALDASILAMAKQQVPPLANTNVQRRKKAYWQSWQYGGSIAASVFIVAFIFIVQIDGVDKQTFEEQAPEIAIAEPDTATASASASADAEIENNVELISTSALEEASALLDASARVATQESVNYQKEKAEAAARRLDKSIENFARASSEYEAKIVQNSDESVIQAAESAVEIDTMNGLDDEGQIAKLADDALTEDLETISLTGSRITSDDVIYSDPELLVEELEFIKEELSLTSEEILPMLATLDAYAPEEEAGLERKDYLNDYKDYQQKLFELLKKQKSQDENWKLDDRLKQYLLDEQQELLERR